ncbi:MAG: hypothetical protein JJ901_03495 [Erythrobacter sp.]|uniref:immunity protein YezG family protein n=1 Tax=Erythrobacter sp. TaxID=1042 RepID=UPI001B259B90|nr:hypothetical protein [Erythrobacter sp.]MBO6767354.1 hypothetical protein [Erythrobacter sp.]
MNEQEQIIVEIGQILMRSANRSNPDWDYCGYMFESRDGVSSGGTKFVYANRVRFPLELGRERRQITDAFKSFREVTRVEGDNHWIKCLAVLRKDGDFKMLFEFKDWKRWTISPANVERAYEILVGEIYPDAIAHDGSMQA